MGFFLWYVLKNKSANIVVMSILYAIILGLVQGATEFIPVSSSGHLVIINHLLGIGDGFTFDVLLNIGTLAALVIFYRKRILDIVKRVLSGKDWSLIFKIILATIPAVAIGLLFEDIVSKLNGMIWVVIASLIVVGIIMIFHGKANEQSDDREIEKSVGWKTTIKIGLAQTIALIPGVSRSGITILAGLKSNLSAARAAEFSFLMAIPIIAGASFKTLLSSEGISFIQNNLGAVIVGNIASFAAGILAISFLIKLLSNRGLKYFGWYRIILAVTLVILLLTHII